MRICVPAIRPVEGPYRGRSAPNGTPPAARSNTSAPNWPKPSSASPRTGPAHPKATGSPRTGGRGPSEGAAGKGHRAPGGRKRAPATWNRHPATTVLPNDSRRTGTMPAPHATRYLHLTRHGEATPDEDGLTPTGRRQAALLGERLRNVPLSAIHHGPLPRAAETARLIGDRLDGVPAHVCEPAGDYVPYTPHRDELPADSADFLLDFVHGFPPMNAPMARCWPVPPRSASPAPWTVPRTAMSWSSPITSSSAGWSEPRSTPRSGAGSASISATRR